MKTLLLWLGLTGLALCAHSQTQVAKTITGTNGQFIGFLEFKPSDYGTQKHPLIIFLHGIGERGDGTTQIQNVTANGIPNYCAHGAQMRYTVNGQTSSFVVLSPQLSTSYGAWPSWYVQEMINYAKANLSIDPNRIYVTGLSLGGGGVWTYAFESYANAAQIAAIAPVCGTDYGNDGNACASTGAAKLPVWAFHSMDDGTVPVGSLQHIQFVLNQCGMTPASRYTYYVSGGHSGCWVNAYDTGHISRQVDSSQVKAGASTNVSFTAKPNIYEWLLTNTRSTTVTPVAVAGANQTITLPLATVSLNGSGSYVSSGSITSYLWSFVSGPATPVISTPGLPVTAVVSLVAGTYVFQLTVTSNTGATSTSQVSVTVNGLLNQTPVANAGSNQTITLPTSLVTLDGSASADPDGSISKYAWTQTSGPSTAVIATPAAAATKVSGLVAGSYLFQLTVTDNSGATNAATVTVTVNAAANQSPVANAGTAQTITLPVSSVTLNGSASADPDGSISKYAWTQVSGPSTAVIATPAAATTTVSSLVAGSYTFQLTVTDNSGATSAAQVTTTVNAAISSGLSASGTGLKGDYYNTIDLSGAIVLTRTDPTVNFSWPFSPGTGINNDNFSVRWSGQVMAQYTETYTFYTTSDDGVRIWVNGQQLINNWTNHGSTENSGTIALTAGVKYNITVEFYDAAASAVAILSWSSPSTPKAVIPQSQLFPTTTTVVTGGGGSGSSTGNGLKGDYYNTIDLSGAIVLTRTDTTVNFNWPLSPGPGINNDNFSVRWSGQVMAQYTETYTFYTTSDDGVRIWVNGQQLINNWTNHGSTENSGTIALTAGVKYNITVEFYDAAASAVAILSWSSPSTPKAVIPQSQLFLPGTATATTTGGTGLQGAYYNTLDFSGPVILTRIDTTVNFNWPMSPGTGVNSDYFTVRWSGQVLPQYSETYTFYTTSDDGIRVWVNGQLVINDWTIHAATEDYGSIALTAGVKYNIVVEYFENAYSAIAQLSWSSPSTPKAIIPQSQLFPPSATTPVVTSGTGLQGDYYNTMDFSGPIVLTRTDTTVNFNWPMSPGTGVNSDYFGVRWTGQVLPQYSETYTFYTNSDDGIRVWVNGVQIINDWTIHATTQDYGSIALQAGVKYNIVVEYFENAYSAVAQLSWSSPSTPLSIIPKSQLFLPVTTASTSRTTTLVTNASISTTDAQQLIVVKNSIAPNPVTGGQSVRLSFNSLKSAPATVQVVSISGSVVYNKQINLSPGLNVNSISTSGLAKGMYIINVISDGKRETFKMIIQ